MAYDKETTALGLQEHQVNILEQQLGHGPFVSGQGEGRFACRVCSLQGLASSGAGLVFRNKCQPKKR